MLIHLFKNSDYARALLSGYFLIVVNILAQVALVPVYILALGKEQFGVVTLVLSLIGYAAIGVGWVSGSVARVLGEYAANNNKTLFGVTFRLTRIIYVGYASIASILLSVVVLFFFREYLLDLRLTPIDAFASTLFIGLYFVILYDMSAERLAFNALQDQFTANIFQIINVLSFSFMVVPWLILFDGGIVGVFACMLIGVVVARVGSLYAWKRKHLSYRASWRESGGREIIKRMMGRLGGGYFIYGAGSLTLLQADVFIVAWLGGVEAAAEYTVGWKIASVLVLLIWALSDYLAPKIVHLDARGERDKICMLIKQNTKWMFIISALIGFAYALAGNILVDLWVGDGFLAKNSLLFIVAGGAIFFMGIARFPIMLAYSTMNLYRLNVIVFIELGLKIALTILLYPEFGIVSPILSIVVVHLVGVAFAYQLLNRHFWGSSAKSDFES